MELYDLLDIRSKEEVRHTGLSNWIMWMLLIKLRGEECVFWERK